MKIFLTGVAMLCIQICIAQFKITGNISNQKKPLANANVSLLNSKTNTQVNAISDSTGKFEFKNVANGNYNLAVSSVGFSNYNAPTVIVNNADINLTTIELTTDFKKQNVATVTSKKQVIEYKADKIVVNVDANLNNAGANALEVLQKAPGVTVDKDGNVSLKGKSSVMIFIDGKPAYVSGADLANLLTNMQSSQLDQIEVMSNPPAKYDAAGNAGIINIKTKRTKQYGFNGSINLNAGVGKSLPTFSESVSLNYRKNKINLFSSINHNYSERYQLLNIDRKFYNFNTLNLQSQFTQTNQFDRFRKNIGAKAGVDYYINKKTTVGIVANGSESSNNNDAYGNIFLMDKNGSIDSNTKALSKETNTWKNKTISGYYKYAINNKGKEVNVDVDYANYNIVNGLNLANDYYKNGTSASKGDTLLGNLPIDIKIFSAKSDYTFIKTEKLQMDAGIKFSNVQTNADAIYDSVKNNIAITTKSRTNFFRYNEKIYASYFNANKTFNKKWSGQLGLRLENTIMNGKELTTGQSFKRNLLQLFPTSYLQYAASEKHIWNINFGRRIQRPDYEDLNPFYDYLDKYTYEVGNPYLQPEFSNNITLSHTYNNFLNTSLAYSITNNVMSAVFITNPNTTETAITQANVAKEKQLNFTVNANNSIAKWWTSNVTALFTYKKLDGLINNVKTVITLPRAALQMDQQFKFKNGWSGSVTGFFISGEMDGVMIIKPMYNIDMAIGKAILKNKGTLRFKVGDVTWSQRARGYSRYNNIDVSFKETRNSRVFNLSFSYRFNKGTLKANATKRSSAGSEEQSRVGS
jgi:iron complex outermembrane recepter protein